jgi:hypothetical protein
LEEVETGLEGEIEDSDDEIAVADLQKKLTEILEQRSDLVKQKEKKIEEYRGTIRQEKVHSEIDKRLKKFDENLRSMVKSTMDEFAPAKGDLSGKLFDEIRSLL